MGLETASKGWRKFYDVQLHNLYSSNIVMKIISRRIRWAEHIADVIKGNAYKIC
jgi:hypothetical protein